MNKDEDFEMWKQRLWQISYSLNNIEWQQFVKPKTNPRTELELTAMDILEQDVEASGNKQAQDMLAAIGIKCND